jgi:hypothetical protein
MASVFSYFSHRTSGVGFTIRLLRGMASGYYSFLTFCFALALALPALGTASSFFIALVCAIGVQAALFITQSSRQGKASPADNHTAS